MPLSFFPTLNAALNLVTAALLIAGYMAMKSGRIRRHRLLMTAAVFTSALFLMSYLYYHANFGSKPYPGQGWPRRMYLAILLTHTVLAAAVPPLALVSLTRGLRGRIPQHRRIARWTFPIWLYVSFTGVVIYLLLYRPWR
jgi:putative membrane protein